MANYANQYTIKIEDLGRLKHETGDDQFLVALNWNELLDVMSDLEPPVFVLWEYLLKWRGKKDGYDFSPSDLKVRFGWSENSVRKYRKILEEKGYLKLDGKTYYFSPYPSGVEDRARQIREYNKNK